MYLFLNVHFTKYTWISPARNSLVRNRIWCWYTDALHQVKSAQLETMICLCSAQECHGIWELQSLVFSQGAQLHQVETSYKI